MTYYFFLIEHIIRDKCFYDKCTIYDKCTFMTNVFMTNVFITSVPFMRNVTLWQLFLWEVIYEKRAYEKWFYDKYYWALSSLLLFNLTNLTKVVKLKWHKSVHTFIVKLMKSKVEAQSYPTKNHWLTKSVDVFLKDIKKKHNCLKIKQAF